MTEDIEPHWTTIAGFISGNSEIFAKIFIKVLAYCSELGLVGGQTFAIDGLRLPSNASIGLTGTAEELKKKLGVYRKMAERHVAKHRRHDERGETEKNYQRQHKHYNRQIEKISVFLETMEHREGKRGQEIKSNVTDNDSAMIMSSSGYIQGYIGLSVSDSKNQVIISAQAVGSANECEHLPTMIDQRLGNMREAKIKKPKGTKQTMLADKNYFSEENLKACEE